MTTDISTAGRMLLELDASLLAKQNEVLQALNNLNDAQNKLSAAIQARDAAQEALRLTASFLARETQK